MNWFNLALVGWIILIAAAAIAAYMVHVPPVWIAIGALAMLGIAVISSVQIQAAGLAATDSSSG